MQPYAITYDRRGFRNDDQTPATDAAIIGDSLVEGYLVPQPALMTSVLERLRHGNVTNLGQGWYGPQQEMTVLKRYALPLHPKVIVWLFYEDNDLFDVQRYEEAKANWGERSPSFHSVWQRSLTKNALLTILRLPSGCRPGPFAGQIQSGLVYDAAGQPVRMYFLYSGRVLTLKEETAFQKTTSVLAKAHASAQAHGARFVVAFVPTKFRVYQDIVEFPPDSDGHDWCANDPPRRLGTALHELSPESGYVDLTPFLAAAVRQGIMTYFPNDTYLSEEGHHLVAEAINTALSAESRIAGMH